MATSEGLDLDEKSKVTDAHIDPTEEQLNFLEDRKKKKEEERLRIEKEAEGKRRKALASLQCQLDDCYASLHEVSEVHGLPFSAKVLSKGNNLNLCKSWHAEEVFLSLGRIGQKLVQKMNETEERINQSAELSDIVKLLAIRLLKVYADFRELGELHYAQGNYVLGLSDHDDFGEVLSFQRKKWRIYVYLDIGSYLSRKFDAWKQKIKAERAREQEEESYYASKND